MTKGKGEEGKETYLPIINGTNNSEPMEQNSKEGSEPIRISDGLQFAGSIAVRYDWGVKTFDASEIQAELTSLRSENQSLKGYNNALMDDKVSLCAEIEESVFSRESLGLQLEKLEAENKQLKEEHREIITKVLERAEKAEKELKAYRQMLERALIECTHAYGPDSDIVNEIEILFNQPKP